MEERDLFIDRVPRFNTVMPCILPYSDLRSVCPGKEKHACGVVLEILTREHLLTHFREEFRFSQQLRGMLICSTFLSRGIGEAYRDSV